MAGLAGVVFGLGLLGMEAARGVWVGPVTLMLTVTMTCLAVACLLRRRAPQLAWILGWAAAVLLGLDFAAAVADRFGVFGPPGAPEVSWGAWQPFVAYTGQLLPAGLVAAAPELAVLATVAEVALAATLVSGWQRRGVAKAAAGLLATYLLAMATSLGWVSVAHYALPVLIGGALLVSSVPARRSSRRPVGAGADSASLTEVAGRTAASRSAR